LFENPWKKDTMKGFEKEFIVFVCLVGILAGATGFVWATYNFLWSFLKTIPLPFLP